MHLIRLYVEVNFIIDFQLYITILLRQHKISCPVISVTAMCDNDVNLCSLGGYMFFTTVII
jgi:hypothetical protein